MKPQKSSSTKILLIEDDIPLAFTIKYTLEMMEYSIKSVRDGALGLKEAKTNKYSLLIVDVGLPNINGFKIISRVREIGLKTPMIVITSDVTMENELQTFSTGANIFHAKPIDFDLLLIQIRSILNRAEVKPVLEVGDLFIEPSKHLITKAGRKLSLSYKEFELITLLADAEGDVLSRQDIMNKTLKDAREVDAGSVDTLVSRIRKKIGKYKGKDLVETVHGVGYRLNLEYND